MTDMEDDLIAIIAKQDERIKELEDGSCRFNCRTMREAFMAGFEAGTIEVTIGGCFYCEDALRVAAARHYKVWRDGTKT